MATHHHINIKKTGTIAGVTLVLTYLAMNNPLLSGHIAGALIGGILPALFWLWFWLKEDKVHPEPKKIIFEAFYLGMIAVIIAIFLEKLTYDSILQYSPLLFFIWAVIEETLKYFAAFIAGIRTKYFDEPIDVVMYMISSALGFSALENVLFIYNSLNTADMTTIPLRFIGASLLHVACSALIGFGIGFGVGKSKIVRIFYLFTGLSFSFALHTIFNYSIMEAGQKYLFNIFLLLWVVIVCILILFEKIKQSPYYISNVN